MKRSESSVRRLALWCVLACLVIAVAATSGCSDESGDLLDLSEPSSANRAHAISGEGILPDGPFLRSEMASPT